MDHFRHIMSLIVTGVEAAGVLIIVVGALIASGRFIIRHKSTGYSGYRHDLGQVILLGLEFLVAADIVRTVAVDHTMENVAVLGMLVLIRTFLSFSLQLEIDGQWPWQRNASRIHNADG